MKKIVFALALVSSLITACDDEGSPIDELIEELNAQVDITCACHQELGYRSRAECQSDYGEVLPGQRQCLVDAVHGNRKAMTEYLECLVPAETEYTACIDERLVCEEPDETAGPCEQDYRRVRARCESDSTVSNRVAREFGLCFDSDV